MKRASLLRPQREAADHVAVVRRMDHRQVAAHRLEPRRIALDAERHAEEAFAGVVQQLEPPPPGAVSRRITASGNGLGSASCTTSKPRCFALAP